MTGAFPNFSMDTQLNLLVQYSLGSIRMGSYTFLDRFVPLKLGHFLLRKKYNTLISFTLIYILLYSVLHFLLLLQYKVQNQSHTFAQKLFFKFVSFWLQTLSFGSYLPLLSKLNGQLDFDMIDQLNYRLKHIIQDQNLLKMCGTNQVFCANVQDQFWTLKCGSPLSFDRIIKYGPNH